MSQHELAGRPVPEGQLVDVRKLVDSYHQLKPDVSIQAQQVAFGTSGHRGSSFKSSFNESHILAISRAICDFRRERGIDGPLFIGADTHALSEPALVTAVEVFAAEQVHLMLPEGSPYVPTPVISHAILTYNRGRKAGLADGVVITPSHNPPQDGGFKYNPPEGGPADTKTTSRIQARANELLERGPSRIVRMSYEKALSAESTSRFDCIGPYVEDLANIIDMDVIAGAKLKIGADPLGGSSVDFWEPIAEAYGLSIEVVNPRVDPTFSFMTVDRDGSVRMDCSSPFAMAGLIGLKGRFDIAFGNDPDADRHGIVTRKAGLLSPNQYLATAVWYLFQNRPGWGFERGVGKTLVSSSMIDRVARHLRRELIEVPVGFKWFVDGLLSGSLGFAGEESAGASFLRKDGTVWTTDKDGIIMDLLACEMTAKTGQDPSEIYRDLESRFGSPVYERLDAAADPAQKAVLKDLSPEMVSADELSGEPIISKLTRAPGNGAAIGGLKVVAENGWFAARPSGTEEIFKIYAESFLGLDHLRTIQREAKDIVDAAFKRAGVK
jgi:phosphoglucomutase